MKKNEKEKNEKKVTNLDEFGNVMQFEEGLINPEGSSV